MVQMTEQEFQIISTFVRRNYGINLSKKKYLMESKLWIELARAHVSNYSEYWQKLSADATGDMKQRMMDLLTTNYSYFLREEKHFEFIRRTVIPGLDQRPGMTLRILCAGCASGQEAYTLAMCLSDAAQMGYLRIPFEITGVDVSRKAVQSAKKGSYRSEDYARLPLAWRDNYCEAFFEGQFTVKSSIREKVHFSRHNLMEPLIHCRGVFQLAFCRNVLIYVQEPERGQMLHHVIDALHPGGYLFVGHTESLMQGVEQLQYIQPAVYRKEGSSNCNGQRSES